MIFLQGIYTLRLKMVAGGGIEPTILELMRLQCYQYTFPRQSVTVIYVGGRGRIQTYESNALQAQPLDLSGTRP